MNSAIVSIRDKTWDVQVPTTTAEMTQGLGGLSSIDPGTGMFFDLGYDCTITMNTLEMLFNLDVAFVSNDLAVTEILRDLPPGQSRNSSSPARYFLEVNSGELEGIEVGDNVVVTGIVLPAPSVIGQMLPSIMTIVVLGVLTVMMRGMWEPKPKFRYCPLCGAKLEPGPGRSLRVVAREHFLIAHPDATAEQTKRWLNFFSGLPADRGVRKYFTDTEADIHNRGYMFQTELDDAFTKAIRRATG